MSSHRDHVCIFSLGNGVLVLAMQLVCMHAYVCVCLVFSSSSVLQQYKVYHQTSELCFTLFCHIIEEKLCPRTVVKGHMVT